MSESRESEVTQTFVTLADTLVDDYDVVELLEQLVAAAVSLLDVSAAGLLLDDQRGNLSVVASSSEETHLLEVFQLQAAEGPCLDCVRLGTPVAIADLESQTARWPRFVPAALNVGFHSVAAVPLRLREKVVGGLNLFDTRVHLLTDADQELAQALADVATIGILQQRSIHRSTMLAEQLQHALNSRVVIEQAKGVLAERHSCDIEVAFAALRQHARSNNLRLTDLALSVIRGEAEIPVSL